MRTHVFYHTDEAYDACQCDDTLKDGDVLICTSEQVVGLVGTWPVAVTQRHGQFHAVLSSGMPDIPITEENVRLAVAEAHARFYPVAWWAAKIANSTIPACPSRKADVRSVLGG